MLCNEYVNADAVAAALSPFRPEEVAILAGRLMLERINHLAEIKDDFAFETTLASRTFIKFLNECKNNGYEINIIFLWLNSPLIASKIGRNEAKIIDDVLWQNINRGLLNEDK